MLGGERRTLDGITFDSTIHCGNGHSFEKVAVGHYRFRARLDRAPYTWRFYFKILCPEAVGQTITLEVADFNHFGRKLFQEGATVISTDGKNWRALGTRNMKIVPWTPTGDPVLDNHYGDSIRIPYGVQYRLKLKKPAMWFAVPTPYTLDRREEVLERLAKEYPRTVEVTTIGHSFHSRRHGYPLRMARIAAAGKGDGRESVFIMAGEHPSESAGMYACEGWMEEVLAHPEWLDGFVFYFVPVVNVDGLYYGSSYSNIARSLRAGIGKNISHSWGRRTLPEVKAIWPLLVRLRPVFFASLHNGRHRRTMEMYGPTGPHADVLLAAWRNALGFEVERIREPQNVLACKALNDAGITSLAYTVETLILCRQKGYRAFRPSYIETGRQLARGTMAGLHKLRKGPKQSSTKKPNRRDMLHLAGAAFTAQLPWFYHGLSLRRPRKHDVYSFEANSLTLPPGDYTVAIALEGRRRRTAVGFDGRTFRTRSVRDGRVELHSIGIRNRLLRFYVKAANVTGISPIRSVWVYPPDASFAEAKASAAAFQKYRRSIRASEREILHRENWGEFRGLLNRRGFGKRELRAMFNDIVAWCKCRQVLDPKDLHYGGIYSEEDKYDFRDAAAAAVCLTYAWRDTGDEDYRRRALLARSYVYNGQHMERRNTVRCGGFCQMVSGTWGNTLQRLGGPLTLVTGVETCIIMMNLLIKTIELGLRPTRKDIKRLKIAADWVARSEFKPGVFLHHEGAYADCQNSNLLAAMALSRAYHTLLRMGERPPQAWPAAARRGVLHYIEGQEAIGVWPYRFAEIGRGQAFQEHNLPDQGMGVYHWLIACETADFRDLPGTREVMQRAARWWLCMSRVDRRRPMPTINLDDRGVRGEIKFSTFTWCRFMAAASLMRIAKLTGEKEPWRRLALRYMEHVHTKLWNTTNPHAAPVKRATRNKMTLCSWIQAAEWDGVLLRDMEEHLS